MPFAGYDNFQDCVNKNRDKSDPKAYCGEIMKKVEGKSYSFNTDSIGIEQVNIKGEKKTYITGYISTKDRDLYDDIVTEKAMDNMLKQIQSKNIKLDFEHEAWREENPSINPVGKIIEAKKDERGIFIKAELNASHSRFKEIVGSIKNGFLDAFSIAYKATDYVYKTIDGVKSRLLNGINLLNVALTGNPVNEHCKIAEVFTKSLEDMKMSEEENKKPEQDTPKEDKPEQEKEVEEKSKMTELKSQIEAKDKEITEMKSKIEETEKELEKKSKELEEKSKSENSLKEKIEKTEAEIKSLKKELDNPVIKAQLKSMDALKRIDKKSVGPLDTI
jgi:HK97 family phage prohead protease